MKYEITIQDFGCFDKDAAGSSRSLSEADLYAYNKQCKILKSIPGVEVSLEDSYLTQKSNHTIIIGNGVKITGAPRLSAHDEHLPSPSMFGGTISKRHLKNFSKACQSGTVRVGVMGDSIFAISESGKCPIDWAFSYLQDAIQRAWPTVKVEVFNLALGGHTWASMNDDNTPPAPWFGASAVSWKEHVASLKLDLLLLHSGGNDGYGIDAVALQELVLFLQGQEKSLDIIFGVTFQPSRGSTTGNYNTLEIQEGIDFSVGYVRSFAQINDFGYLDFGRWHAMCRDGFDPLVLSLTQINPEGNLLPEWGEKYTTPDGVYYFPHIQSSKGVFADRCTDWHVTFTLERYTSIISFQMSGAKHSSRIPSMNACFIHLDREFIEISLSDGVSFKTHKTTVKPPSFPAHFGISLKSNRLRITLWDDYGPYKRPDLYEQMWMEMGFTVLFDSPVIRFGAPYSPHISLDGKPNSYIFYNFLVADTTKITDNCQRYRPCVTDYELYEKTADEGGSDAYHLNSTGTRKIIAPVIYAQNWRGD